MNQTCNRCKRTYETEGVYFKHGLCEFCLNVIDHNELNQWKEFYKNDFSFMDSPQIRERYAEYLAYYEDGEYEGAAKLSYEEFLKTEYDYWSSSIFRG